MKNTLYVLIISILFSCTISYPMQQSINTKHLGLFACITAGCGISLYIINQYKYPLINWLTSFRRKLPIDPRNDSIENNEISLKNNIIPSQSINNSEPSHHTQQIESPINQQQTPQYINSPIILPNLSVEDLHQNTEQYLQKEKTIIPDTTELHVACENNDIQAVTVLLQNTTTNVNAKRDRVNYSNPIQECGETPLHIACQNNNTEIVKILLACNGDTTIQNKDGDTPLHIACQNSNEEIVDLLLAYEDAKITLQNSKGNSPLHIACKVGDTKLSSTFLNKMFLINIICDQQSSPSCLFPQELKRCIATFLYHSYKDAIVQKLLNCDSSNLNKQNRDNESAIYLAYLNNHKTIFSLLFNHNNIDLTNLLPLACQRHDMYMITQLLKDKNIKIDNSKALCKACENGYDDIVALLLLYNKNNCMKINDRDDNPLLVTCKKIETIEKTSPDRTKFVTIMQALLNDPAIDINIKAHNGLTVFHFIVSDTELLEVLLNKDNRFINQKETSAGHYGHYMYNTPLHNAIRAGNSESIFLLLKHDADISIKGCCKYNPCTEENCYGDTPLTLLCKKASKKNAKSIYKDILLQLLESPYVTAEIINSSDCLTSIDLKNIDSSIPELLLKYGANSNKISNQYKVSPVLKAAQCNIPLLNLFVDKYKGDITQKNKGNQTVLYIAFMEKQINHPNEINFFNNLSDDKKSSFMEHELALVANFTPKNIFTIWPSSPWRIDVDKTKDSIKIFNNFITTCTQHVQKNFNTTLLLETAYAHLQKRNQSFYLSSKGRKCNCMHLNEKICRYDHDSYHPSHKGCNDCAIYFNYNELIMHTLIQHINPITREQAIDKTIALTYKQEPTTYYLKKTKEKENLKKYIKQEIEKLNYHT